MLAENRIPRFDEPRRDFSMIIVCDVELSVNLIMVCVDDVVFSKREVGESLYESGSLLWRIQDVWVSLMLALQRGNA